MAIACFDGELHFPWFWQFIPEFMLSDESAGPPEVDDDLSFKPIETFVKPTSPKFKELRFGLRILNCGFEDKVSENVSGRVNVSWRGLILEFSFSAFDSSSGLSLQKIVMKSLFTLILLLISLLDYITMKVVNDIIDLPIKWLLLPFQWSPLKIYWLQSQELSLQSFLSFEYIHKLQWSHISQYFLQLLV